MNKLRPFSEEISTGGGVVNFIEYPKLLTASLMHKYPPEVSKQLQILKILKQAELRSIESGKKLKDIVSEKGELLVKANKPREAIEKAERIIKSYRRGLVVTQTGGMSSSIRRELKYILNLDFKSIDAVARITSKIPEKEVLEIAKSVAREAAKKSGTSISTTMLVKWTKKIVPWVAGGFLFADLVSRATKAMEKNEKSTTKFESNIIPYGENYHPDVGWY